MSVYEHSLRVAMMIKPASLFPGSSGPAISPSKYVGQTYSGPVELLDIYKTTIDLAGLPRAQLRACGGMLQAGEVQLRTVSGYKHLGTISAPVACPLRGH